MSSSDRFYSKSPPKPVAPEFASDAWVEAQVRQHARDRGGRIQIGAVIFKFDDPAGGASLADRLYGGKK